MRNVPPRNILISARARGPLRGKAPWLRSRLDALFTDAAK